MKMVLRIISIICCFIFFLKAAFAVEYPVPSGYVNDFANLYSEQFKSGMELQLSDLSKSGSAEIAVVTVKSLEGIPIEEYAVKLFEKWKVGKKGVDNGLLLLIAKDDREVRIEVGYGLEPYITDGRAGDIIRNEMVGEFKNSKYEAGTQKAVGSLTKFILNQDVAPPSAPKKNNDFPVTFLFLGIYFLGTYLASFLGRTKEIWPGGLIGGILGLIIGLAAASLFGAVIIGLFAGLFGLFMDFILSRNFKIRKDKGLPTSFWSSGGGFSSGGGGSSFGGFGGGSSGGGGASGRW